MFSKTFDQKQASVHLKDIQSISFYLPLCSLLADVISKNVCNYNISGSKPRVSWVGKIMRAGIEKDARWDDLLSSKLQ